MKPSAARNRRDFMSLVFFVCVSMYLIQRLVSFVAAAPLVSSVAVSVGVLLW